MKVYALNVSKGKGVIKRNCKSIKLINNYGVENDSHAGKGDYQVSFFSVEAKDKNSFDEVGFCFSRFIENICTMGLDISKIKVGSTVKVGETVLVVTQAGKECFDNCPVKKFVIDSCEANTHIMFAKVISGGVVYPNDKIEVIQES
ncbi:MAG: hypothetical protein LBV08_09570 [Clostridiales bacterium]|nr:hypothetical protein [Clostridiales bacterium]